MATNAILMKPLDSVTFTASGGSIVFTLDGVAAGAGRSSAVWDRGEGAKPATYKIKPTIKWADTATLGDTARVYKFDSATATADLSADGDVTPESKFGNFKLVANCICTVAANRAFYTEEIITILGRYVYLGLWNGSATKALHADANASFIVLTPHVPDIQAAT
jgi:hypothetical protein